MAVNLSPVGGVAAQFFTSTGAVLTGGKLYTYAAGTTTPAVTYTSSNGLTAWTNPIVLDAAGRVPGSGEIWLTDGINYKFVLKDANDVLIATYDNISGINSNFVAYTNAQEIQTATAGQTVFTLTTMQYQPGTNSLSVFVDGVNQYGSGAQYAFVETDSTTVTFNAGLHVGAEIKFTTSQQQGAGAIDASQVTYDPPFTGSAPTNVEAKLAQTVSVLDFGADPTGVVDSTTAFSNALATSPKIYAPAGTYLLSNLLIDNYYGVVIQGDGPGNWRTNLAPATIFKYTGGSGGSCIAGIGAKQLSIRDVQFDGNNLLGHGFWAKNAASATNEFDSVNFHNVNFYQCINGIKIGDSGAGSTNFSFWNFTDCTWWQCNIAYYCNDPDSQLYRFYNCSMMESNQFHVQSLVGMDLNMDSCYLGAMTPGATACVSGPIRVNFNNTWVEAQEAVPTLNISIGNPLPSSLINTHISSPGNSSGYSIYYNSNAPMFISSSSIAGQISQNMAIGENRIVMDDTSVFIPAAAGISTISGSNEINVRGTYTSTQATFTVEIVSGGAVGTATWRYKKGSGAWSSAVATQYLAPAESGLVIGFLSGATYSTGDSWSFVAYPCGIIDSGYPDNLYVMGAKANRDVVQSIPDTTETTILYTIKNFDPYEMYSTTTGIFTIKKEGYYQIGGVCGLQSPAAGQYISVRVKKDSAGVTSTIQRADVQASATTGLTATISAVEFLKAGDSLYLTMVQNAGLAKNSTIAELNNLSIVKI